MKSGMTGLGAGERKHCSGKRKDANERRSEQNFFVGMAFLDSWGNSACARPGPSPSKLRCSKMKIALSLLVIAFVCAAGAQPREPWTTSQIEGTPEPPKAFVSEEVLSKLKFSEALELAAVPGTDRLLVVERRGKVSSFSTRGDPGSADLVVDLLAQIGRASCGERVEIFV